MTTPTDVPRGPVEPAGHPSDETIGAYLEGGLGLEAREALESHAAGCESCVALLASSFEANVPAEVGAEGETAAPVRLERPRSWPRTWVRTALAAAAAVAAGIVLVLPLRDRFSPPLGPLVEATRMGRTVEARLTGGFVAAPLAEVERGAGAPKASSWGVIGAAEEVRKSAAGRPLPESLRLEGIALLSTGHVDDAIGKLEEARRALAPPDVRLLSDLSAAYLERCRLASDPSAAARALELALAALEIAPRSPEALFNRALATERLGLRDEAVKRYDEFLAVEAAGGWAEEARRRRSVLVGAGRGADRGPPRAIERQLLPGLARAVLQEPRDEAGIVALLGKIERGAGADRALLITARRLATGGPAAGAVARGLALVAEATESESKGLRGEAGERYREAERRLDASGDPFRLRARLGRLIADYHGRGYSVSPAELEALAVDASVSSWPSLAARARWMAGLVYGGRALPEAALDLYERARRDAEAAGDPLIGAALDGLAAEVCQILGRDSEAWSRRARAFAFLRELPPARAHTLLLEAAQAAEGLRLPRLALDLLETDDAISRATDRAAVAERAIVVARLRAAREPSAAAWRRAEAALATVRDPGQQARLASDCLAARALASRPEDVRLLDLDRAIDYYVLTEAAFRMPELLVARAAARNARGLGALAKDDASRALSLLERELASGGPRSLRMLVRSGAIVDEALDVIGIDEGVLSRIDRLDAFRGTDLRRVRGERRPGARAIQERLGAHDGVLWFRVGERRSEALLLLRDRALRTEIPFVKAALEDLVAAFRGSLVGGPEGRARLLAALLHSSLLRSVPGSVERLVIVPDGVLWTLPFSALREQVDSAPFGARVGVSLAVSGRPPAGPSGDVGSVALLADPRTLVRDLPRLPGAAEEVVRIAPLYGRASVAMGEDATVTALRSLAAAARVLHVAAHALPEAGTGGRLLLSGDDGAVSADAISALDLRELRTAVVAGCATAAGEIVPGEGTISLARAFLAAGARTAVASVWAVPDGSAADLLVGLHRGLAAGLPAAEALRRARADYLAKPGPDARVWAAFEAYE